MISKITLNRVPHHILLFPADLKMSALVARPAGRALRKAVGSDRRDNALHGLGTLNLLDSISHAFRCTTERGESAQQASGHDEA